MKKIVLVLVVLVFAAPAMAAVNITLSHVEDTNVVTISWDATGEANLIRAFGLNIQLSNDANIISATGLSADYWVYPGTIQIAADGEVTSIGSIAAEYGDLMSDTLVGPPDGNGVTLECASLYAPPGDVANAPPKNGVLAEIIVGGKDCVLCVTANVSRAGATGVVMENPDEVVTVVYGCIDVNLPEGVPPECYKGSQAVEWAAVGEPECWCAADAPAANPRQCHGDADGTSQGKQNFWVSTNDLDILVAAWNKPFADLTGNQICADFNHASQGKQYFRVSTDDLDILVAGWNQQDLPLPDCP